MSITKPAFIIVDDDDLLRELLRYILRDAGYDIVAEAKNGQGAIDLCQRFKPDFALIDINMPIKDGITALEEIKAANIPTKVIIISSEATLPKVQMAIAKGATGFIVKPITADQVIKKLNSITHKK